jgi:hypothetical protein
MCHGNDVLNILGLDVLNILGLLCAILGIYMTMTWLGKACKCHDMAMAWICRHSNDVLNILGLDVLNILGLLCVILHFNKHLLSKP